MKKYKIGDIIIGWDDREYELNKGPYFQRFMVDECEETNITFVIKFMELGKFSQHVCLQENMAYELYNVNGEKFIIYHWRYCRFAFGFWLDRIDCTKENICYIDPSMKNELLLTDDWFFGLCGLTKALLQRGVAIYHAAYIGYENKAILFAGPSQTGKSTQAKLWNEVVGAEIINGDRVALRNIDGKWYAYGYPCCGSSNICINKKMPLSAIVLLEQGSENKIIPIKDIDKIRSLMAGIELYKWDVSEMDVALAMSEKIINSVSVIKYRCRPNVDSVNKLKEYMSQ